MADFNPAFGANGARRAPTTDEQSLGFACGPADRELFNYLAHLMQGQVKNIADEAGVASNAAGDLTVLYRAVAALISAATGDEPAGYMLSAQFLARHPTFPEVLNTDGKIVITAPSTGVVRVPGGVEFLHRGFGFYTTAQEDLNTDASKTYHLRWNPTDGFELHDLASGTYNPSTLAETNITFDSTYDDMLVARVVTNSSNVATITNLANKSRLAAVLNDSTTAGITNNGAPAWLYSKVFATTQNWARKPDLVIPVAYLASQLVSGPGLQGSANAIDLGSVDRYGVTFTVSSDFDQAQSTPSAGYILNIGA